MIKRMILAGVLFLFSFVFISAQACSPEVSLINQDPYPAIPGEYVKLVFQIDGLSNAECRGISFELVEKYPISFDKGFDPKININTGFYEKGYSSFLIAPYKVRVDGEALKGNNPIETKISYGNSNTFFISDEFNIYIEDSRANFEIHIDKYSYTTREMTLEILNIANTNIEALTLQIDKQENIEIIGSNRVIAGDLDSNEYTTVDFEAIAKKGEVDVKIIYTDQTGTRRELIKTVEFNPEYFAKTKATNSFGWKTILTIIILISFGVWWFLKKRKTKEGKMRRQGISRISF